MFIDVRRQVDMQTIRKRLRLRIPAPRWPSKDHRLFQTIGCLAAWRSRHRLTRAAHEDRPVASPLPALSRIVGVRREDAVLHVELRVDCATAIGRPPVLARDRAGAPSAGATSEALPDAAAEGRTWTVSLVLN
ncbi:MAG: hypothetical protein QOJ63_1381 [Solirubrobacteraceae bacterium]|jgi:hypothetical protein|nr:hypothetical protein [Solirubrobacteraceae bacterium]